MGESPTKLDAALRGLAEMVRTEGNDGNLAKGGIIARCWLIDVMVRLTDLSAQTRSTLEELVKLKEVFSVKPLKAGP